MHMLEAFAQKPKPVSAPEQFPSLVEDKRWYAKDTALFGLCNDLRVLTKAFAGSHQIFEIGAVCSRSNEDISNGGEVLDLWVPAPEAFVNLIVVTPKRPARPPVRRRAFQCVHCSR